MGDWFGDWIATWLGAVDTGGGGGGTPTGGNGGGPGTYAIPAGLSFEQKKALAALLACAPCCQAGSGSGGGGDGGSGSGDGSGSGGGGFIPCCGCFDFPLTLNFTATSSCLGTISGTLTRAVYDITNCTAPLGVLTTIISYTALIRSGTGYEANGFSCVTGSPVSGSDLGADTALFSLDVSCIRCPATDPPGKGWFMNMLWYDFNLGTFRRIELKKPVDDPSCSPLIFSTVNGPVVCLDDITTPVDKCAIVGSAVEPWTTYTACDGSTFTLDVSE